MNKKDETGVAHIGIRVYGRDVLVRVPDSDDMIFSPTQARAVADALYRNSLKAEANTEDAVETKPKRKITLTELPNDVRPTPCRGWKAELEGQPDYSCTAYTAPEALTTFIINFPNLFDFTVSYKRR